MTHSTSYGADRELVNWKIFQKVVLRLHKRIFKEVKDEDKAKVRMLSIRKVTKLNQGEKIAGTYGKSL